MGMDAGAKIWVGVVGYNEDMEDKMDEADYNGIQFGDHFVKEFRCCEEIEGYGVEVLNHDWNSNMDKFDIDAACAKIQELKPIVQEYFGPDADIGVYLQANYS